MAKVVFVTGSAKGIGAACIKKFALEGYDVVIHYRSSETSARKLENWIKENTNSKTLLLKSDIQNEEEVKKMVTKIIDAFGHIDVLVNNAALEINSEFEEKNAQNFLKVLNTNLVGTFLVSKYVSKWMLEKKTGKIINITSNNAINQYDPSTLEYDASKAGMISLTHNLALQLAPYINVNAVAPGWVMTEKVKELNDSLDGMLEQEESKHILIQRFAYPEEVASLVYFLSTEEARSINNQVITIDGGTK
ncbi:SDR family oxidoreductase [bacterium]|nr:SDR family oxidoreductase [bacterium]